jgi:hypothetical protein
VVELSAVPKIDPRALRRWLVHGGVAVIGAEFSFGLFQFGVWSLDSIEMDCAPTMDILEYANAGIDIMHGTWQKHGTSSMDIVFGECSPGSFQKVRGPLGVTTFLGCATNIATEFKRRMVSVGTIEESKSDGFHGIA